MPSSIYLYVDDCDRVYEWAIQGGSESVMEVTDIPFNGERHGGVKDSTGYVRPMTPILMVIKPD
jgi:PhnB protein